MTTEDSQKRSMKNRALLTHEFMPSLGGIERLLHERSKNFNPEHIYVITPNVDGAKSFDAQQPYHVIRSSRCPISFIQRGWRFFGPAFYFLMNRKKFSLTEIECGQAFPFPFFAMCMKKIFKTDYVVWIHGNDLIWPLNIPIVGSIAKKSLMHATKIIANSKFVAQLVADQGVPKEKIFVHSQIIDTNIFKPGQPSEILKKRYNLEQHKVILSIGRLIERKGFDSVLACMPQLLKKHNLKYVIVGNGPYLSMMKDKVRELNIEDNVVFAGGVTFEELPMHYHIADVFVMVSKYLVKKSVEGLGLVYLEASASKVPVVAGNSGGVSDAVHHETTGLLVDPNDLSQIEAALDRILSDSEFAKKLGENGYQFANQPADWTKLTL